ncbi:MAG: hypothetical protein HYW06_10740 [Gemmatimonadetes bacterium]|nr:hypothetical protein [Gemmatimonadota bacterium]
MDTTLSTLGREPALNRVTEAYRILRDLIVRGRLAPGSRIIEADVAAGGGPA